MDNMEIYNKGREVPTGAKRTIAAGKLAGFTDINPMWRIQKLTELFGTCGFGWYTEIMEHWTEKGEDGRTAVFVLVHLYVKNGDTWSNPIVGIGGSTLVNIFKGRQETSDEAYKMAYTDAISVACKALGIGADVYWQEGSTKYTTERANNEEETICPQCGKVSPSVTLRSGRRLAGADVIKKYGHCVECEKKGRELNNGAE